MKNFLVITILIISNYSFSQLNKRGSDINLPGKEFFGEVVAVSGNGSTFAGSNFNEVKIVEWDFINTNDWIQKGQILTDTVNPSSSYGTTLSFSSDGNTLAIGSPVNNGYGQVQIFTYEPLQFKWIPKGNFIVSTDYDSHFGRRVSLSDNGNVIAVGSPEYSVGNVTVEGKVNVFEWNGSNWVQVGGDLTCQCNTPKPQFGERVKISNDGTTIIASADALSGSYPTYTLVYQRQGNNWVQKGSTLPFRGNSDVSINGNGSIVSTTQNNFLKVYEWDNTNWVQKGNDISIVNATETNHNISENGETILFSNRYVISSVQSPGYPYKGAIYLLSWDITSNNYIIIDSVISSIEDEQFANSSDLDNLGSYFIAGTSRKSKIQVFNNANVSSIKKTDKDKLSFSVFPNPTNDIVSINFDEKINNAQIKIYNSIGKVIFIQNNINNNVSVDLKKFNSGIYFIELKNENTSTTKKIILK